MVKQSVLCTSRAGETGFRTGRSEVVLHSPRWARELQS